MSGVSVLVLTLNEETNLRRCLESVDFADDVVILDSFSTDHTCDIAQALGARVVKRTFDDWSSHQNWAVDNIEFRNPWVLYVDADEIVEPELSAEVMAIGLQRDRPEAGFFLRRKDMLFGTWLRHSSMYPVWILRLFRPDRVRWERVVNPVAVLDGPAGWLEGHLIHYSFGKGISSWVEKHAGYARMEAKEALRERQEGGLDLAGTLVFRDPVRRRQALKKLSYRLPFRPYFRFLYTYLIRRGVLDGRAGLTYSRLIAFYEYMIDLNVKELRQRGDYRSQSVSEGD